MTPRPRIPAAPTATKSLTAIKPATMLAAAALLAGCVGSAQSPTGGGTGAPPSGSYPTGLDNTCDGERYGPLVGQDATALERVLIMGQVRVLRPGSIVTQDYRPERINFEIDGSNRISKITCG